VRSGSHSVTAVPEALCSLSGATTTTSAMPVSSRTSIGYAVVIRYQNFHVGSLESLSQSEIERQTLGNSGIFRQGLVV
jgi:hypothetical protein